MEVSDRKKTEFIVHDSLNKNMHRRRWSLASFRRLEIPAPCTF